MIAIPQAPGTGRNSGEIRPEAVTRALLAGLKGERRHPRTEENGCPHCTEYLAQMRKTIELTGTLTPDDLTPQMQDEFIALYRQWRADDPGEASPEG